MAAAPRARVSFDDPFPQGAGTVMRQGSAESNLTLPRGAIDASQRVATACAPRPPFASANRSSTQKGAFYDTYGGRTPAASLRFRPASSLERGLPCLGGPEVD